MNDIHVRFRTAVALGVLSASTMLGCAPPARVASSEPAVTTAQTGTTTQKKYPLRITLLVHPLPGAPDATRCVVATVPPYADFWTTEHSEIEWRMVNHACPGLKVRIAAQNADLIRIMPGERDPARIVGTIDEAAVRRAQPSSDPGAAGQRAIKYNVYLDGSRPAFNEDPVIVIWP